ncbi:MAG: hypothetical protein ACM3X0_05650 [Bacteroidota bacterium]
MQIRQLQVATDSVQDRLVLRVATEANEEFRVFFTRRFLREVWPHLSRLLARQLAAASAVGGEKTAGDEPASFEQAFKEDHPFYPLGATPLLASEASFEQASDEMTRLILREGRERSFSLNLTAELLQALCSMLRAASEQAKWDLGLNYETPSATSPAPGKSLLH